MCRAERFPAADFSGCRAWIRRASSPAEVADQTGRVLAEREPEWLERLTTDPASFAALEREVHEQARRQADLYVAGLLAKAGESPAQVTPCPETDRGRGPASLFYTLRRIMPPERT